MLVLMEDKEFVSCPMSLLQQEYTALMQRQLTTGASTIRGDNHGPNKDASFGAVAAKKMDAVELHERYTELGEESLAKDTKILTLQQRIAELEENAAAVQRSIGLGGGNGRGSPTNGDNGSGRRSSSAGRRHSGFHRTLEEKDRSAMEELERMNLQLSEHIETLEHNIAQGFHYSDVAIQKEMNELQAEKEDLLKRNMELATCFLKSEDEKRGLVKRTDEAVEKCREATRSAELLEKELAVVRTELNRVKKQYQEKALAAL